MSMTSQQGVLDSIGVARGSSHALERRSDVEGLRAIAVLCVVAYHVFPAFLPGGFIGVDVFFVISGYLISRIIMSEISDQAFDLPRFYAKRVRRIFPALITLLGTCCAAGWLLLNPFELKELGTGTWSGAFFVSNFVLWGQAGYFDAAAEAKPMLHLWSLAVEEQFYLVWPVLLMMLSSSKRSHVWMAGFFAVSLSINMFQAVTDPTAAFYLPLGRFWEFGIGFYAARRELELGAGSLSGKPISPGSRMNLRRWGLLAGLTMIAGAAVLLDSRDPFPGAVALVPTIGAGLLIACGGAGNQLKWMASAPMRWLGTISYPLYLWHWPLFYFCFGRFGLNPGLAGGCTLVAGAIFCAWATMALIERPVRASGRLGMIAAVSCTMLAVLGLLGLFGFAASERSASFDLQASDAKWEGLVGVEPLHRKKNLELLNWFDYDPRCVSMLGLEKEADKARKAMFCSVSDFSKPPAVVVFGDSTANHLFPGMANLYKRRGESVLNVGDGTCAPFRGLHGTFEWNSVCESVNEKVYAYILSHPEVKTVILGFAPWDIKNMEMAGLEAHPSVESRFAALAPLVARDLHDLHAAGKRISATFDSLHLPIRPEICMNDSGRCVFPESVIEGYSEPYLSAWHQLMAQQADVCVFDQKSIYKSGQQYRAMDDGLLLYRDDHHLSFLGSEKVAQLYASGPCYDTPRAKP